MQNNINLMPSDISIHPTIWPSNQIKSEKLTPPPKLWGACYSRLKIKIHNNYYKMRLGYVLKGRK